MKVIFQHKGGRRQPMQRRFADILQKLGRGTYLTRDMRAATEPEQEGDELPKLRAQYQEVVGKRPYHGWDAAALREKIAEARAE